MLLRFFFGVFAVLLPAIGSAREHSPESDLFDVTQMSIEELVETEFIPASRIARQISDAPSAVSIVTSQDIREYGYRTLSDILKSLRGLYVTSSLDYEYLGGRGFGSPGDYAGRIMLTVDGYVTNDNIFGQIYLGEDALMDVELIDRVEFIPGPGSTTYGNGAFLGVINIVTKHGKDVEGTEVALGFGNKGRRKQRLTAGGQLTNGAEYLLSASRYRDDGLQNQFPLLEGRFGEDPFENRPVDFKKLHNRRLFFKGSYEGWSLEVANVRQLARDATFMSSWDSADLERMSSRIDDSGFASLKYDKDLGESLKSSSHVYYGQYLFEFQENATNFPRILGSAGRWWGADVKFVGTWFASHKLLFGGEYRDDYQQKSWEKYPNDDISNKSNFKANTLSLYLQDEYRLTDRWTLVPGVRYDKNSVGGAALSPRMAVLFNPTSSSVFKLSYGSAFRYATLNELELQRSFPEMPEVPPENVSTTELVWQQQLGRQSRVTISAYRNTTNDAIGKRYTQMETLGQEIGVEHISRNGTRLNASVTHQESQDDLGFELINSPKWLAKFNIAQPLFDNRVVAGFEVQTLGRRPDAYEAQVKSETIANLTLSSSRLIPNANVSLRMQNLFNTRQVNVLNNIFDALPKEGRDTWLQLEYRFK